MAKGNFKACLAVTLPHEGGYVNHPKDPGGHTNKGVTLATMRSFYPGATVTDLKKITNAQVQRIYEAGYWSPVAGEKLPAGVDLSVFDYGVNSGPSRSVKDLQRVLNIKVDGKAGPQTEQAAGKANGKAVIQAHCARRLSFMRSLKIWETFKRGWSRRVADIEAKGVAMWLASVALVPAERMGEALEDEADKAKASAEKNEKIAGGSGAGGVAVGGGDAVASGEPNWLLIGVCAFIGLALAALLIAKARQNRDREEAYRVEAASVLP